MGIKCLIFPSSTSVAPPGVVMVQVTVGDGKVIVLALDLLMIDTRQKENIWL